MKLAELGLLLGCRVMGDANLELTGVAPIEHAKTGEITFLSNPKYKRHLANTAASAVILSNAADLPEGLSGLVSDNPYLCFAQALEAFHPLPEVRAEISPLASIAASARLGVNVTIGPFTVIGEQAVIGNNAVISSHCRVSDHTVIGANSLIHSHCVIREGCQLGARVILQNHVTIGSDGFGFAQRKDKSWHKILQLGIVVIEDDVEIGAGSAIDRAAIGITRIGKGTKLDNLVQVGHGVTVGQHSLLCAQVGMAGSSHAGNHVILAGQVGVVGHLTIGDNVVVTAQAGVPGDVPDGRSISGSPAFETSQWRRAVVGFQQLPELLKEVRRIKERLTLLETQLAASDSSSKTDTNHES